MLNWIINPQDNYFLVNPYDISARWHVVKRDDGWYWYTVLWHKNTKTSSEFGPFSNPGAAMADCEVAHRPMKTGVVV